VDRDHRPLSRCLRCRRLRRRSCHLCLAGAHYRSLLSHAMSGHTGPGRTDAVVVLGLPLFLGPRRDRYLPIRGIKFILWDHVTNMPSRTGEITIRGSVHGRSLGVSAVRSGDQERTGWVGETGEFTVQAKAATLGFSRGTLAVRLCRRQTHSTGCL
jgi:hypothetical protein